MCSKSQAQSLATASTNRTDILFEISACSPIAIDDNKTDVNLLTGQLFILLNEQDALVLVLSVR